MIASYKGSVQVRTEHMEPRDVASERELVPIKRVPKFKFRRKKYSESE